MKTVLCFFIAALYGISFAQNQNYTFSDGSFIYLVRIYSDVAIGEEAFGINRYQQSTPLDITGDFPSSITDYEHAGLDSNGTLHLLKEDIEYSSDGSFSVDSEQSYEVSVDISEPLTFEGDLTSPDIELDIQVIEGGKLNITLVNADAFEVFTE
jgi:hypothetical protein